MVNVVSEDYRGYQIDAVQANAAGWQVNVYASQLHLPPPPPSDGRRLGSAVEAIGVGRAIVDALLSA